MSIKNRKTKPSTVTKDKGTDLRKEEKSGALTPKGAVIAMLDKLGVEFICDEIINGNTLTAISRSLNIARSSLFNWIRSDSARSARVYSTRVAAADVWDDLSEICLREATDVISISRARELASHYRWRAKAIAPRAYGDRKDESTDTEKDITIKGGLPD